MGYGRISEDVSDLWISLVNNYLGCQLTFPEDKLYTFSGITKLFQQLSGNEFLADVWRSHILRHIAWQVERPAPKNTAKYRAPSWLWASINGPVEMKRLLDDKPSFTFKSRTPRPRWSGMMARQTQSAVSLS
ncbi:hypothetical protein CSHISOI_11275 [Colletotrichum shisoi]|uniref:Uncharacterized protein n=1 Tax=Colletotrichum shisoi TaxID=2078593 RepID=A0A5Q4BB13_9PEZI|nr:hypothetical protein CSHISOI_11275 [Colletotrichum shisoi]